MARELERERGMEGGRERGIEREGYKVHYKTDAGWKLLVISIPLRVSAYTLHP